FASQSYIVHTVHILMNMNIQRSPNNHYTFDSERDAPQSEICRDDPNNHECITLQMNSRQMFAAMQVGSK
ncbi:hypothetical protein EV360DRAFT_10852, partial [Lentinula raphanica]